MYSLYDSNLYVSIFIKVLGMDLLPPQKFAVRQWRFGRKRRRSGTEGADSEGNEIFSMTPIPIYY